MGAAREILLTKLSIPILFFLTLISCGESTNESITNENVIATIGSRNITYDEIKEEGVDQNARNREITALNRVIRDEIINQEIAVIGYEPSGGEIEEKVIEIYKEMWEGFDITDEEKIKIIEKMREQILTLIQALEIWKEHQDKGDEFAKTELIPLGISQEYWEWVKSENNNPELVEKIYVWKEIGDITLSNLDDIQLKINRKYFVNEAQTRLKMEKLRMQVVPNYKELHEADQENEFRAWLRKRMAEKTVIYDDNYKLALEIY